MNLHQVLTGAVNPGDNCFSVGSLGNVPFTAYASGCDVVILGSDFERLQIIPGAKHGNVQVGCVDCSQQGGQIAASYGNIVCIFEPVPVLSTEKSQSKFNYQWQKSGQFVLQSIVHNLAWHPTGTQLLTGCTSLQLWSNQRYTWDPEQSGEDLNGDPQCPWKCIWQCKTASPVHFIKFSPGGDFFATAGQDDCLVKVWYSTNKWQWDASKLFTPPQNSLGGLDFSFIYLAHPRSVTGFSWRKTSKYMPGGSVCNVLLTCCKDSVCRLWAETLLPSDYLLFGLKHNPTNIQHHSDPPRPRAAVGWMAGSSRAPSGSPLENFPCMSQLNLRETRRDAPRHLFSHMGPPSNQQSKQHLHKPPVPHANALCHFHIAASINPATDIPLLPSISSLSTCDDEEPGGPFTVHWLNNKELQLTLAMEVFLQQLRSTQGRQNRAEPGNQGDDESSFLEDSCGGQAQADAEVDMAAVEHHVEVLLEDWNRVADMIFSIHPMDGSLLVWNVDWLDEYQPGMFRQVQVSFVSRIPVAFPTGDANSLSRSVVMYACNKNVDLAIQHGRQQQQQRPSASLPRSSSSLISSFASAKPSSSSSCPGSLRLSIFTPSVLMISKHADGSLNQWTVSFAEESAFSTVLSVSHRSRYCGHRFHLNDLACHSLLPLLLTTSHHNALRSPEVTDPSLHRATSSRRGRVSSGAMPQDPNAIYSELILWRVDPVGPLSFSGGVSELARINSLHSSAFSNVAWLPSLVPSRCMGLYGNSPSACFVASDGHSLRLYQAVIEAKKLLSELANPEISKYVGEVFNIISQQSTARPGCIIELDVITDFGKETQLLHVFEEDLILGRQKTEGAMKDAENDGRQAAFSARFFLVVVELTPSGRSLLHMWHLDLAAVPITIDVAFNEAEKERASPSPENSAQLNCDLFIAPPGPRNKLSNSNLQSACRLSLTSHRVFSQELGLPSGVEVIRVTPAAGHLSSSSLQPAGRAPYLLATSCSDGKVRFWRCGPAPDPTLEGESAYVWEEWPLLLEEDLASSSAVSVSGQPTRVSCCHNSRVAVAYRAFPGHLSGNSRDTLVHVAIFQCESTGGSHWLLEQTLIFDCANDDKSLSSEDSPGSCLVHLDWVSREDGSHILTVGIGSKLYMYGPLSGKPPELGLSQGGRDTSRLVLLRTVDLVSSVEGSLPLPVSLSWVRDGILVVGMDCEMHVYSQWQPPAPVRSAASTDTDGASLNSLNPAAAAAKHESPPPSPLAPPPRKTLTRSMTSLAQKLSGKRTAYDLPPEMEDRGLFETACSLFPTLPQYHPFQLLELMDLGKVRRAKAILSHLVKCIAGEVVALRDGTSGGGAERRLRSRTISAGGSTPRDSKFFHKAESADYAEIDSVPPLPLYALIAADDDDNSAPPAAGKDKVASVSGDSGHGSSPRNDSSSAYDELFQPADLHLDHALDSLGADQEDAERPKVIDLSQYKPTAFGPEHAQVLSSHLLHSSLPGLTRMEQMSLMALADTVASTRMDVGESQGKEQGGEMLDECGLKFLLAVRLHTFLLTSLPPAQRAQLLHQGLSTCHYAWAFHSEAEEELLSMLPAMQKGEATWPELRAMGVGWWLRSTNRLRRCIEKVAKASFQRNSDPLDAALFYLAMKKKAVVWGLYRSHKNVKMTEFFSNNFGEDRWRRAALKNAFSLLGKQRFQHSAAFFLLAGSLKDAVEVCVEKMQDLQLALVISRLYESEFETSSTFKRILQRHVLGHDPQIDAHPDPFLRSIARWVLDDYSRALDTLLEQPSDRAHASGHAAQQGAAASFPCNPEVFNFYTYLRTHPLLMRRHFGSPEKSRVGLTAEARKADSVTLVERRLFFTAAHAHLQAGCPMLALEVLSKMPKVIKRSKPWAGLDAPSPPLGPCAGRKSQASDFDWPRPVLNGFGSAADVALSPNHSHSDSVLSFDWSQPSASLQDEPLELRWDSEKENSDDDDGAEEGSGLAMKALQHAEPAAASPCTSTEASSSFDPADEIPPSEDILAAQLKFSACLKILTTELRTLSTGYELDGGKLRYQLCHWLEREVLALQKSCGYNPFLPSAGGAGIGDLSRSASGAREEAAGGGGGGPQRSRRLWLQRNQPLLRIFLSYCSLHGSHGGGLASVRMELILLLQESQQEECSAVATLNPQLHASVPLLLACTASSKTVVANPVVHLANLTHDILHTINGLDSPPHPDTAGHEIHVMHTLAASLSACIYQCLCDGHSYSQVNQFTGIVYESVLLSPAHTSRYLILGDTLLPDTSPAQWPGISALVRLLSACTEEGRPGLAVLLCEILTAVFLSLFAHGLATHSSQQLFRTVAHPLNSKLWVAVFGGGAQVDSTQERPAAYSVQEDVERKQKLFRLRSSRSRSRDTPDSPLSPSGPPSPAPEQNPDSFTERFVPPELSIWDFFIAKPFLPPSESRVEYDSEESQGSEEEEDDDEEEYAEALDSNPPIQEHSNHNSYSWCLMRLAMVQIVLGNLKSFYPMAGYDLMDLPVASPLCHTVLKTLQRWEQVLLKRLEIFGGPPPNYISTSPMDESMTSGPALLRHKALFEPSNTPFRSRRNAALPVKRLWHYLVKQEAVQETFIRNIFTKKRDPNEVETDLGSPVEKARIVHKDSDIITAFAINKANRNCLVIASTHDIQELDVSSILATQILTWIDEDDVDPKGSDEFLVVQAREDFVSLHGSTPYTHSSPGTPINMPWLGSMQTGRGAAVLIKRNITNVRRMASHPTLPYYLTGAQDGSVRMFEWGHAQQITCFRSPGNSRVTRIRFNYQGNKFGVVDSDGSLSLWQTNSSGNTPKPYLTLQCHNKTAHDFVFVGSSSLIATAGLSIDNRNVCLWDTLVTPSKSLVHAFTCHESEATVLSLAPKQQLLLAGGRKGWISVLDLAQRVQRQSLQAHDSPVKALAVGSTEACFISGSAEGNLKVWSLSTQTLLHSFPNEHSRQSLFRNLGTGVMQIEVGPSDHVFSCGADGTMKMRVLPDRHSAAGRNDVKFII
ncbi:dmX-like protein 1 isoform X2 [Denticeps clupeoides]|uniref:dmX-like protein 1 isoform X2 n=1 Tax=Denticeps clupeoides TaxID=299321 RepID=UPI0010A36EAF|nr:dmX-like protein 1 isoform X2 [Denticeps clupeoides]